MALPLAGFINGRLSISERLWALSALFCVPIVLLAGLFIAQSWKDIAFAQKELAGGRYEQSVWPMVRARVLGEALTPSDAAGFMAARQRDDATFKTAQASADFLQAPAGQRAATGVQLMSSVADGSNLALDPDLDTFYLTVAVAFRLPPLLEAAHSLTAATTAPQSDRRRTVKIAEDLQTLGNSYDAAAGDLDVAMRADRSGRTASVLEPHAALLSQLGAKVASHSDALFDGAAGETASQDVRALEVETDRAWIAANGELQRLLTERVNRLLGALALNLGIVLVSLVAAGSLGVVIVRGIASRTLGLVNALERLIAGDTTVEIPFVEDTNEGARIARGFVTFKAQLIESARAKDEAARQQAAAEEVRAAAEAERARVTRFLAVGEMASSIAHEINQPIAAVVAGGAAAQRWLESQPPNLDRTRTTLSRIVRDANRASDVVKRIRAILQRSAPELSAVDLNDAVQEALQFIEWERGKARVATRLALAKELPLVKGDRVQLQQVVINLAMNAIDAMRSVPAGKRTLTITTLVKDDDEVEVSVEDSGPGLEPGIGEQLFEPFYTSKPTGMGLGLSISRSIVGYHGGKIWAEASAGGGAAFRFTLSRWVVDEDGARPHVDAAAAKAAV